MKIKVLIPLLCAIVVATTMMSGKVEVNLDVSHHIKLPTFGQNKPIQTSSHIYDIYMTKPIKGKEEYLEVVKLLDEASSSDTINFHLGGPGGAVDSIIYLANHIRQSAAKTVMIVEAPVYSGHAYLALVGKYMKVLPDTYFMYHTSSAYGTDCSKEKGTDRTRPESEVCQTMLDEHLRTMGRFIDSMPILTPDEKLRIKLGYTLMLDDIEVNRRIKEANHAI